MPLIQGPLDIGFHESLISSGGIQAPPYNFFRNDMLDFDREEAKWWTGGSYNTSYGISIIIDGRQGEGDPDWDASTYDMVLVNETKDFIERHLDWKRVPAGLFSPTLDLAPSTFLTPLLSSTLMGQKSKADT